MKFGIKKSHKMISYILVGMALLREQKHMSSTKPLNLAQMALDELHNKIHKRFMLRKCQENAPMDHKG
jgi:hypothetical protein